MATTNYDNKLSGALFKNDKGDNPNRPDYKGSFTDENGKDFWVSAWVKKSKDGSQFLSMSMQPKEVKPKEHTPKQEYEQEGEGLPF